MWHMAKRFIAGERTLDGLRVAQKLNGFSMHAILDHLGEEVTGREGIEDAVQSYEDLVEGIAAQKCNADTSLKLSQFGIRSSHAVRQFINRSDHSDLFHILHLMNFRGIRPWLDAERLAMRDPQWQFVQYVIKKLKLPFLGTAFQAYGVSPYDSMEFFKAVIPSLLGQIPSQCTLGIRLCLGAYRYSESDIIRNKKELHARYCELLKYFFEHIAVFLEGGPRVPFYLECASHDPARIEAALRYAEDYDIPKEHYRLAFLYGRQQSIASHLVKQGVNVAVYIPFGAEWSPYILRRIVENPAHVLLPFKREGTYHDCRSWPDECTLLKS